MSNQQLAKLDPDWAINEIANGAFLRDISAKTGIDKRRLSEQLRKHPDYASAKECAIEVQLDRAQEAIEVAREAQDIARAREQFRAAAWRAEREAPKRWAQQSHVTMDVTHHLGDSLMRAEQREREINPAIEQIAQTHVVASANSTVDSYSADAQVSDSASE